MRFDFAKQALLGYMLEFSMHAKSQATVAVLYRVPEDGKAELVNGEIVLTSPTGGAPGYAADENPYHRGEVAEAEPALPGWRMAVDDLFE